MVPPLKLSRPGTVGPWERGGYLTQLIIDHPMARSWSFVRVSRRTPVVPFAGYLYCEIETAGTIRVSNRDAAPEAQASAANVKDKERTSKSGWRCQDLPDIFHHPTARPQDFLYHEHRQHGPGRSIWPW